MPGPLDGVRVLEFTEIIAGPFAGMMLSDMGADVIKVEPPWGEPWRFAQEFAPTESRQFISLNRGKRSLPLDLTKPEALEVVYKLVRSMDVVIVNARPDVPANLGIDYETLSELNPGLIYCDNTAFGRNGPNSYRPGYDLIVQAMTGLMVAEEKVANGVPQPIVSTAVADFTTGVAIAWGVSAALYSRERTGKGQKIETTLLGTSLALQTGGFLQIAALDDEPRAEFLELLTILREQGFSYEEILQQYRQVKNRLVVNWYYRTYQTKDGVLAVGCLSDPLRERLANVIGLDDSWKRQRGYYSTGNESQELAEQIVKKAEEVFLQKTTNEWLNLLDKLRVPAGQVRFVEELVNDEQVVANDLVVELDHSVAGRHKMVGPLMKMSETPLKVEKASPALGEHTADILGELGYSPDEIKRLREDGITR